MSLNVLIYGLQYRPNLSSIIRSAEFYGLNKVYIYDSNQLLVPPGKGKKARADMQHMARVWTAGAIEFIDIEKVEDDLAFLQNYPGRKIATLVNEGAQHLNDFQFQENDLIIMGNERDGLPEQLLPLVDHAVYIPSMGQTSCLNVAVSFGVVLHQALRSLE